MKKLLKNSAVEWKTIEDIFTLKNGYTPSKAKEEYWRNGNIPWFRMEDIRENGRILTDSIQHISTSAVKGKLIPANSLLMSTTATLGEHALILVPYLTNQQITSFSLKESYLNRVRIKFLFYCFYDFGKWCANNANKNGGLGIIGINKLKQYLIPIPPLHVQTEIVRILDSFTALTAELTAELTTRKKQYNYYRDKLLTFKEDEVEWKTLGEVGQLIRGNGLQKKDFTETGVPAIHYGQIYTYYGTFATETKSFVSAELAKKLKKVDFGDVVITNTSENLEDVGKALVYLGKKQAVTGGHATIFKPNNSILGKYFTYFTQTSMFASEKRKYAKGTKVIDVSATDMSKIIIPIPPLKEQARIVEILDKFDALTNSITEGLPREIALRQKQYEYYRNLLLDFPKDKE
ncbi:restriction endonuclease subunit S [Gilliamella sp. App4-10]|uniref:restriction endonuclease subunit S n=1 Tax=Gilliamella sp. App4-10 TaxID=3120231 RepID=UPI00080E27E3|nr:restriction endonuclease subunit S [Gilliamella apicola]OCG23008.1 restriction endonuclease subunit S [Gilliamella apicola]